MSKEIKIGIVGAPRGRNFFRAFQVHPETQIVALCDVDEGTLAEEGRKAGVAGLYTLPGADRFSG